MPNPVVHFEVTGPDGAGLRQFYADAFGWKIDANNPMNYGTVEGGDGGIRGGIGQEDPAVLTFYIEVDDPAAYLERVKSLGGRVIQDVTVIPGVVTIARFADPCGNVVGLVKAQ